MEEVTAYATQSTHPDFAKYEYPTSSVTIVKFKDGRIGNGVAAESDFRQVEEMTAGN